MQLAGFDFGQIENVIDDVEQVMSGDGDLGELIALARIGDGALEQVGQADNGVHRSADFMAHIGQKFALAPAGGFGGFLGDQKFSGAVGHPLFEMPTISVQFIVHPLFRGDVFLDRQIVGNGSIGLAHQGDRGQFDVFAAVLAPVDQFAAPGFAPRQGSPHLVIGSLGGFAGFKHPWIEAERFLAAVAGIADESLVDVFNAGIQVGDDDAFHALIHRQRQFAELIFGAPALRDVFLDRDVVADLAVSAAHRNDSGGFDHLAAILGAIDELAFPGLAGGQRPP